MVKAVDDGIKFDLIITCQNCNPGCLQDIDLVGTGYLVLHSLPEKAVERAPIIVIQVPDNPSIARLQL